MAENQIDRVFRLAGGRRVLQESLRGPNGKPLSKQTMSDWKRAGKIPPRYAAAVEKMTGVSRKKLCPDFDWAGDKAGV